MQETYNFEIPDFLGSCFSFGISYDVFSSKDAESTSSSLQCKIHKKKDNAELIFGHLHTRPLRQDSFILVFYGR